jgi:hypothetical protein
VEKFPLLLNRLVQRLHVRNAQLFSQEEQDQLKVRCYGNGLRTMSKDDLSALQGLFTLSGEQLKLILDGCCYIFEQVR